VTHGDVSFLLKDSVSLALNMFSFSISNLNILPFQSATDRPTEQGNKEG
jgi:hypothetical protein